MSKKKNSRLAKLQINLSSSLSGLHVEEVVASFNLSVIHPHRRDEPTDCYPPRVQTLSSRDATTVLGGTRAISALAQRYNSVGQE